MYNEDQNDPNVVNLADARKRQKTLNAVRKQEAKQQRAGANGRVPPPGQRSAQNNTPNRLWVYLQVILFLLVVAYFMQVCQGR